jgi:DNA-directed RNA polymerase subunit RPC12/RpoP
VPEVVCQRCGTRSPSDPPPLGWSAGTGRGRTRWVCERCARENLRSIEGKLDEEWW